MFCPGHDKWRYDVDEAKSTHLTGADKLQKLEAIIGSSLVIQQSYHRPSVIDQMLYLLSQHDLAERRVPEVLKLLGQASDEINAGIKAHSIGQVVAKWRAEHHVPCNEAVAFLEEPGFWQWAARMLWAANYAQLDRTLKAARVNAREENMEPEVEDQLNGFAAGLGALHPGDEAFEHFDPMSAEFDALNTIRSRYRTFADKHDLPKRGLTGDVPGVP